MRATTSKRIRKNTITKPNNIVLVEIANIYGTDRVKEFSNPRNVYKAAKDIYKNLRKSGNHKKANLFIQ